MTNKNLEKLAEIGEKKLLDDLNLRTETKIAVGKIINSKYSPQTKIYAQINSQLNIKKY